MSLAQALPRLPEYDFFQFFSYYENYKMHTLPLHQKQDINIAVLTA